MKPKNIIPPTTHSVNSTINIRSRIQNTTNDIDYYAKFRVAGASCTLPKLSIFCQDTDFDGKPLDVYFNGTLITSCGSNNGVCGDYKYCLENYTMPLGVLAPGTDVTIQIRKSKDSGVPSGCTHSLWADVTFQCGIACEEIDEIVNENSRNNELTFDVAAPNGVTIPSGATSYQITGTANNMLGERIDCGAARDCVIQCDYQTGCLLSDIYIHTSRDFTLSCTALWSCFGAEIIQPSDVIDTDYIIICDEEESCREMSITASNFTSFVIYCNVAYSCQELSLSLAHSNMDNSKGSVLIYCIVPNACPQISVTLEIVNKNQSVNDGEIHCVSLDSCTDATVNTNSEFTKLIMYEYSHNIIYNNGYGYIPQYDNLICNDDKVLTYRNWMELNVDLAEQRIRSLYMDNTHPCESTTIQCEGFSCDMTYDMRPDSVQSILQLGYDRCAFVHIPYLQNLTCAGECVGLGTRDPTMEPTAAPTAPSESPTTQPTYDPTSDPTNDPTRDPTTEPTTDPTIDPTIDPTADPTSDPTANPTSDPTSEPTTDPTTGNPTSDPTVDPTSEPTSMPICPCLFLRNLKLFK